MSRDEWNALVDRARACDMLTVAAAHGAKLSKYTAKEFVGPCPLCGGNDRFSVNPKERMFFCRGCAKGGHGAVDLEMFCAGVDFTTAVKQLTKTVALGGKRPATKRAAEASTSKRNLERAAREASQHAKAAYLWSLRHPVAGTPVEAYLQARGFRSTIPATIGYLPAHGEDPHAMISAYALPNEAEPEVLGAPLSVRAVHLTRLNPDGSDRLRDKQAKITVGSPAGLPIAIACITDGLALAITEGIEDALAYVDFGMGAWAAGSAPFIPSLAKSIPDYVTSITIEQHDDPAGQTAVAQLRTLLTNRTERPVRAGERPVEVRIREEINGCG
jgi:putative DNA primase/helicase